MTTGAEFYSWRERFSVDWCGLMSGTSGDGVDAAVVRFERDRRPRVLGSLTEPFPESVSKRLLDDLRVSPTVEVAAYWDRELANWFSRAALSARDSIAPFDAVALSGHTFAHRPDLPSTLQFGNPALVAEQLQRPVVAGFRASDVARGGEGAPLVPAADRRFFGSERETVVLLNVGGISNLTWIPAGDREPPRACDCGPGNLVLNAAIRAATDGRELFDQDGERASRGQVDSDWVGRWLDHPFFEDEQRSTGREDFGEAWFEREVEPELGQRALEDVLASLADWIARAIRRAWDRLARTAASDEPAPTQLRVGGGGAHHADLMARLRRHLPVEVHPLTEARDGVHSDDREAAAFAALGDDFLQGRHASFPTTTGCARPGTLGALWLPSTLV